MLLPTTEVEVELAWFGGFFIYPDESLIEPLLFEEYFDTRLMNFEQFKVYMEDAISFLKTFDLDILQYDKMKRLEEDDKVQYDKVMFELKKHLISCEFLNNKYKNKIFMYETVNYIDRVTTYPIPPYMRWFQIDCDGEKVDWNRLPSKVKDRIVSDSLAGEVDNMTGVVAFTTLYRFAKRFNAFCRFKEADKDTPAEPYSKPVPSEEKAADSQKTHLPEKEEKPAVKKQELHRELQKQTASKQTAPQQKPKTIPNEVI